MANTAQVAGTSNVSLAAGGLMNLNSSSSNNQDLASLFECPVCFDYVLPPIMQCQAGHLVCSTCRPKLTCCPTCRGQLGANIRNLAMEKAAHEETCEFRPYSCPCPGASC